LFDDDVEGTTAEVRRGVKRTVDIGAAGHVARDRDRGAPDLGCDRLGTLPVEVETTTFAPSRANTLAISAPKPEAAPVTSAVLSLRRIALTSPCTVALNAAFGPAFWQ
jgi:hypothetical protein